MSRNVLILMTALVPTTGHRDIISFAASIPDSKVWILINERSFEPVTGELRLNSIRESIREFNNVTVRLSLKDAAPQNPTELKNFWLWWQNEVNENFPEVKNGTLLSHQKNMVKKWQIH